MNKIIFFETIIILLCMLYSCKNKNTLDNVLNKANDNRLELLKVIDHYQNTDNKDSLKLKAALFLIENMPKHGSIWSEAIDTFRQKVYSSDTLLLMEPMNEWWNALKTNDKPVFKSDLKYLKANFLIQNIDKAFKVWQESPWKSEGNFDIFCRYILPYRFETELLVDGWRDTLYNEYHPLVKGVKTVKEAYEVIHDTVWKRLLSSSSHFPYTLDVVAIMHQRKAMCIQRCIMLGSIMRALGIPATIDNINRWANYGNNNSHAWTSLVTDQGTYSIYEDEWEAKINNRIDATIFEVDYPIAKDYPLATQFKKKYAKIERSTFEHQACTDDLSQEWQPVQQLVSPFAIDVSAKYGLNGEVTIQTDNEELQYAYLCTFATGQDWMPVCYEKIKDGKCTFSALGDSVAYAVMGYHDNKPIALENPFLLANHQKYPLTPDKSKLRRVELTRKYPLTGKWMNKWAPMTGSRFEGSNDPDFKQTELLYSIDSMPVFHNIAILQKTKPFRYVRYVSPADCEAVLAEIVFMGENGELKAVPGNSTVRKVELSLDKNMLTRPDYKKGFTLGYDLGSPQKLTSIVYFPWNDDNFVVPGHEYELFYYDKGWISLGKQTSDNFSLIYENVPDHALLYLKDYTRGAEERPFTYVDGKQIWW